MAQSFSVVLCDIYRLFLPGHITFDDLIDVDDYLVALSSIENSMTVEVKIRHYLCNDGKKVVVEAGEPLMGDLVKYFDVMREKGYFKYVTTFVYEERGLGVSEYGGIVEEEY